MKKIAFITLLLLIITLSSQAQSKFNSSIKVSFETAIEENKNKGFGIEFLTGYNLSEYFFVGIGTGISYCDLLFENGHYNSVVNEYIRKYRETGAYIPLYANAKAKFIKEGITPYISLNVGYSFLIPFSEYVKKAKLGLMVLPALGVEFPLSKGAIFAEIGYKYQSMSFNGYNRNEKLNYSQASISIGYKF